MAKVKKLAEKGKDNNVFGANVIKIFLRNPAQCKI
jgi:hypothetical protein